MIEVECPHSDFVSFPVWCNLLICLGIEEHPSDLMRLIRKFDVLVLDIGEDLIQFSGMSAFLLTNVEEFFIIKKNDEQKE